MMNFTQCRLQKGLVVQIGWIPAKFAVVGKLLRLKEDGIWNEGWTVVEIWETVDEAMIPDQHDLRKAHKRATGDVG